MTAGTLLCYLLGAAWFMLTTGTNLWGCMTVCVFPFIPGDVLKILLSAALCLRLQKPLRAAGLCV